MCGVSWYIWCLGDDAFSKHLRSRIGDSVCTMSLSWASDTRAT